MMRAVRTETRSKMFRRGSDSAGTRLRERRSRAYSWREYVVERPVPPEVRPLEAARLPEAVDEGRREELLFLDEVELRRLPDDFLPPRFDEEFRRASISSRNAGSVPHMSRRCASTRVWGVLLDALRGFEEPSTVLVNELKAGVVEELRARVAYELSEKPPLETGV